MAVHHQDVTVWAQSVAASAGAVLKADGLANPKPLSVERRELCQIFLYDRHDSLVDARIVRVETQADLSELVHDLAADHPRVRSVSVWQRGRCIDWRLAATA